MSTKPPDDDVADALPGERVSTAIMARHDARRIMGGEADTGAGLAGTESGELAARAPGVLTSRDIAGEVPISFVYNGLAHAVMMATPADLEDFATGFTLTQEIVNHAGEIEALELRELPIGFIAAMTIPPEHFLALTKRRRNLVGQTGCGLCGVVELTQAVYPLTPIEAAPDISREAIFRALEASRTMQPLNAATGAMHAAFFVGGDGVPRVAREDVGRHNALDKLIGHMARNGVSAGEGFFLTTSRCSYELVEKAVIARVSALVTISAPTGLAIARAQAARLTLVALARPDSALVFNDPFGVFG